MRLAMFMALASFSMSACGAEGANTQSGSVDAFLDELATAGCDAILRCPSARNSQVFVQAMAIASPEACHRFVRALRDLRLDYPSRVTAGVLAFDASAGQRCLASFKLHCEEFSFEDLAESHWIRFHARP